MSITVPSMTPMTSLAINIFHDSFPAFPEPIIHVGGTQLDTMTETELNVLIMKFADAVSALYPGESISVWRSWTVDASHLEDLDEVIEATNPPE